LLSSAAAWAVEAEAGGSEAVDGVASGTAQRQRALPPGQQAAAAASGSLGTAGRGSKGSRLIGVPNAPSLLPGVVLGGDRLELGGLQAVGALGSLGLRRFNPGSASALPPVAVTVAQNREAYQGSITCNSAVAPASLSAALCEPSRLLVSSASPVLASCWDLADSGVCAYPPGFFCR